MNIKKEIVDSIKVIVKSTIEKTCPTISFGVVNELLDGHKCNMTIDDIEHSVKYYGNDVPMVNQKYPVFVPFNNMSLAFIMASSAAEVKPPEAFTVTLTVAGWSNNKQTISDTRFKASGYSYIVTPASASFKAYGESQIYADDISTNGQIVFNCEDVPTSALTVNVTALEVTE